MTRSVGRAGKRLAIGLLAIAVLAGCTSGHTADSGPGATATVTKGTPTSLTADGITVTLPADAVPAGATLQLTTRTPDTTNLPEHLRPAGRAAVAEVEGGTLTQPATVTFPTPAGADGQDVIPVVVWQDGNGGWRWLPTDWTPGAPTISATTDHFSFGFAATIDVQKWGADRANSLKKYVTGRSGVAQPTCGDEQAARADGIQVSSDGGDSVKWCFGTENGRRVLKVANNRRTYTEIDYPSSWQVADPPSSSFTPDTLARALGAAAAIVPTGDAVRIVDGGDTLTLVVPPGKGGSVVADISSESFLIDAIFFGVDTYTAIANVANATAGNAAQGARERIASALTNIGGAGQGYRDALNQCGKALTDVSGPVSDAGPDLLKYAWDCVPALMKADIDSTGVTFFAAGIVLAAVGAVAGFVLTAVHLLIAGLRELWDSLASIGGNSDPSYDIRITGPNSGSPDEIAWWSNQVLPTGWETGETVTFQDGRATTCSEQYCGYSLSAIAIQPATSNQGITAALTLVLHDGDGFPLGQTLMVLSAEPDGLVLHSASDTAVSLPETQALCDTTLIPQSNGDVKQTFSNCADASGDGSEIWHLSGTRLALG